MSKPIKIGLTIIACYLFTIAACIFVNQPAIALDTNTLSTLVLLRRGFLLISTLLFVVICFINQKNYFIRKSDISAKTPLKFLFIIPLALVLLHIISTVFVTSYVEFFNPFYLVSVILTTVQIVGVVLPDIICNGFSLLPFVDLKVYDLYNAYFVAQLLYLLTLFGGFALVRKIVNKAAVHTSSPK